jgi:ribosomal protein S27E
MSRQYAYKDKLRYEIKERSRQNYVDCSNCEFHKICFGYRPNFKQFYTCDGFQFEKND